MTTPREYFEETLPSNLAKDPDKAKSLGQSLRSLGDSSLGTLALHLIAVGFAASALFTLYESRYRVDA